MVRRFEGHGSRVNGICFGGDESSGGKSGVGSGGGIVGDAILFSGSYDRTVRYQPTVAQGSILISGILLINKSN